MQPSYAENFTYLLSYLHPTPKTAVFRIMERISEISLIRAMQKISSIVPKFLPLGISTRSRQTQFNVHPTPNIQHGAVFRNETSELSREFHLSSLNCHRY